MKSYKNLIFGLLSLGILIFFNACTEVKKDDTPWEECLMEVH